MLKYKKGLISDGFFKYTRNPNYLGEIGIYFSFVFLVNHLIPYIVVSYMWFGVFYLRMGLKDNSLRQKEGWEEYEKRSWLLFPKINGRTLDSLVFYASFIGIVYAIYARGGIVPTMEFVRESCLTRFGL